MTCCIVCNHKAPQFEPYGIPKKLGRCPHCRSKPRNRAMAWFLEKVAAKTWTSSAKIIEIGASKFQTENLSTARFLGSAQYSVVDIRRLKHHENLPCSISFLQADASNLPLAEASTSTVFCNYVLQDAPNFTGVLNEIQRILTPQGWAMINVAFFGKTTKSCRQIRQENPDLSDDYFDTNGRQQLFGEDFLQTLESLGMHAGLIKPFSNLNLPTIEYYHLRASEQFIFASKDLSTLNDLESQIAKAVDQLNNNTPLPTHV